MRLPFPLAAAQLLLCACSLDYQQESAPESTVPEFSFENGTLSKYEKGVRKSAMSAATFEQYKGEDAVYARGVEFRTWNDKAEPESEGSCGIMSADQEANNYLLFDGISVRDFKNDMEIRGERLRYNGNTEQITSGAEDEVTVRRDDIEISGRGFSASGPSRIYKFTSGTSGTITTDDDDDSDGGGESGDENV